MRQAERNGFVACTREKSGLVGCPGRCACIEIPGDPRPYRFLDAERVPEPVGGAGSLLSWETKVDFCARNLPLAALATFFDREFPDQVLVPAAKINATVSRQMDAITLGDLAADAGLVTARRSGPR